MEKQGDPLVGVRFRLTGVGDVLAEELESLHIFLQADVKFLD